MNDVWLEAIDSAKRKIFCLLQDEPEEPLAGQLFAEMRSRFLGDLQYLMVTWAENLWGFFGIASMLMVIPFKKKSTR